MNHPFRLEWWTRRRALLWLLLVVLFVRGISTDPLSAIGEALGLLLVLWLFVAAYGGVAGLLPGAKDPEGA